MEFKNQEEIRFWEIVFVALVSKVLRTDAAAQAVSAAFADRAVEMRRERFGEGNAKRLTGCDIPTGVE